MSITSFRALTLQLSANIWGSLTARTRADVGGPRHLGVEWSLLGHTTHPPSSEAGVASPMAGARAGGPCRWAG